MDTGSFLGVKRPGGCVDHPPHLAPKLKKEYSYTSTPRLGLRGLFWGELYSYVRKFDFPTYFIVSDDLTINVEYLPKQHYEICVYNHRELCSSGGVKFFILLR